MAMHRNRVIVLILLSLPLAAEFGLALWHARGDRRDDALAGAYEIDVYRSSSFELTGDAIPERLVIAPIQSPQSILTIVNDSGELYRLPFDQSDSTYRTHVAVVEHGTPHLLVYDGASQSPPARLVLAWDGRVIREVEASDLDSRIISAMAARDDTGGWHERTLFRPFNCFVRLSLIYGLVVISLITCRRRASTTLSN
jgi:hypothetical protein